MAKLVFLGRLADLAGGAERSVAGGPLAAILADLPQELALAVMGERTRWAINGNLVSREAVAILTDADELAFLPPVSGG